MLTFVLLFFFLCTAITAAFDGEFPLFVEERARPLELCISLSHTDLQRDIVVTLATESGTATGIIHNYTHVLS